MTKKYIDKSAIVAEIDSLQDATMDENRNFLSSYHEGIFDGLSKIENFLDTLEVKEVDLEKECDNWRHNHFHGRRDKEASGEYLERSSQLDLAKHFYELGLKTKENKL